MANAGTGAAPQGLAAVALSRRWWTFRTRRCGGRRQRGTELRHRSRFATSFAVEYDAIRPIAQTIQRCRPHQFVRKRSAPFVLIEVARQEGRRALIACVDEIMEILILWRAHWTQAKVVDGEDIDSGQLLQLAVKGAGRTSGIKLSQEFGM